LAGAAEAAAVKAMAAPAASRRIFMERSPWV
jgi:hypothetical protein